MPAIAIASAGAGVRSLSASATRAFMVALLVRGKNYIKKDIVSLYKF